MSPVYLHVSNFKHSHSVHYALNAGQSIVKKRTRLKEANPKHIRCWMNHSIMASCKPDQNRAELFLNPKISFVCQRHFKSPSMVFGVPMTFVLQSFALQSYCMRRDAKTLQELVGFQGSAYLNALKYSAKTAPFVFESLVVSCEG